MALNEITGRTSVPQVFVNGEFMGGNDDIQKLGKGLKKRFFEAGVQMD